MAQQAIRVKVEGLAELRRALLQLPEEIRGGPLRAAVSAGLKVVQQKAIADAPIDTGTLKRAIYRTRSREGSSRVQEEGIVGVRSGKKFQKSNRDAWYWRFLEFGTRHIAAQPFLRPAFDSTTSQQIEALRVKLAAAIERAAAKLSRGR